jgi:leucyl aminopeptidase (aminopeptidase T)
MKRKIFFLFVKLLLSGAIFMIMSVNGMTQVVDYVKIAQNIVKNTAQVKPGDQVVIEGGKHLFDFMEILANEVVKAGGKVIITVNSDKLGYTQWHEIPYEYLKSENKLSDILTQTADVYISLPFYDDHKSIFSNITSEKQTLFNTIQEKQTQILNQSKVRAVNILYPQKDLAELFGFTEESYKTMIWGAIEANYTEIAEKCAKLNDLISKGKQMRISSPDGTDFKVNLAGRQAIMNDGIITPDEAASKVFNNRNVTLPTGRIDFVPSETSGNGTIVTRNDVGDNFLPLEMIKGNIKDGEIISMDAATGNDYIKSLFTKLSGEGRQLGSITIGTNPYLTTGTKPLYYLFEKEGFVTIGFGNNTLIGGTNNAENGWYFPVLDPTVEIDGKIIIEKGKLKI